MQKETPSIINLIDSILMVPAIPAILFTGFVALQYQTRTVADGFIVFITIFLLVYLIGIIHVLILGIPALWLGLRLHAISWWSCILVGFVIGGLPVTVLTQAPQVV